MLQILDEKILRTDDEIESMYKDCKYISIVDSYDRIADNNGYLYCISTSHESFTQLISESNKLREQGKCCVIGGSYNDGGAIGEILN